VITSQDRDDLEPSIAAVTRREPGAWDRFEPMVDRRLATIFAEPRFFGSAGADPARRSALRGEILARLRAGDFQRLRLFLAALRDRPALSLTAWLRVVAKRARIDDLRRTR
jgi:hypothetical protein